MQLTKHLHVRRGYDGDGEPILTSVSSDEIGNGLSLREAFESLGGDFDRPYADSIIAVSGQWPADPTACEAPAPDATVTLPPPPALPLTAAPEAA